MKPSAKTAIAVKILKLLSSTEATKGRVIASNLKISEPYFEQIAKVLKKSKLINTKRGAKGGYLRSTKIITLWDVIKAFEPNIAKFYCDSWSPILTAIKESAEKIII